MREPDIEREYSIAIRGLIILLTVGSYFVSNLYIYAQIQDLKIRVSDVERRINH